MTKNLLLLIGVSALALAYTYYTDIGQQPAQEHSGIPAKSETQQASIPAPDFTFQAMDGKTYSLAQFRGKAVVLNFWATWCAPCVVEFPQMLALAAANTEKSVFVFLSQDDTQAAIDRFIAKYGASLPQENVFVARDDTKTVARNLYQTHKLPETYMIDPGGMIREKVVGAIPDWSDADAQRKLDRLFE